MAPSIIVPSAYSLTQMPVPPRTRCLMPSPFDWYPAVPRTAGTERRRHGTVPARNGAGRMGYAFFLSTFFTLP